IRRRCKPTVGSNPTLSANLSQPLDSKGAFFRRFAPDVQEGSPNWSVVMRFSGTYLRRAQTGLWYFRVAIPPALRPTFGRKELVRSLRTSDRKEGR
ncbi:MAG: hypothetical protein LC110_09310, partial [Burkholderiales bacterium]|nr:hypothetical protein [Burkholderiales bacterium]